MNLFGHTNARFDTPPRRAVQRPHTRRPSLEALEDRTLPSITPTNYNAPLSMAAGPDYGQAVFSETAGGVVTLSIGGVSVATFPSTPGLNGNVTLSIGQVSVATIPTATSLPATLTTVFQQLATVTSGSLFGPVQPFQSQYPPVVLGRTPSVTVNQLLLALPESASLAIADDPALSPVAAVLFQSTYSPGAPPEPTDARGPHSVAPRPAGWGPGALDAAILETRLPAHRPVFHGLQETITEPSLGNAAGWGDNLSARVERCPSTDAAESPEAPDVSLPPEPRAATRPAPPAPRSACAATVPSNTWIPSNTSIDLRGPTQGSGGLSRETTQGEVAPAIGLPGRVTAGVLLAISVRKALGVWRSGRRPSGPCVALRSADADAGGGGG